MDEKLMRHLYSCLTLDAPAGGGQEVSSNTFLEPLR